MNFSDTDIMMLIYRAGALAKRSPSVPDGGCCSNDGKRPRGRGRILSILKDSDGITQREIAERLDIRPQSLSEALALLEDDGLARKEANPSDKREMLVYITEEGLITEQRLRESREKRAAEYLSILSSEEKATLFSILSKLTALNKEKEN